MLLERLHLRNFKRFRDQDICFGDGITGIVGSNGAGKSTIVEAILFGLYGVRGLGSSSSVVSATAGEKAKAEVVLEFTVRGERYEVYRSIRRKASTHDAKLMANGKKRAEGVSAVNAEIVRVLGMSHADFKNTIYAGQKDLLSLLSDDAMDRRKWFMRVLGIDYLRDDTDRELKARIDSVAARCRELEGGLAVINESALAGEIAVQKRVLEDAGTQLNALAAARQGEKGHLGDFRQQRQKATGIEKRFIQLREQHTMRTAELERMAQEIAALETELQARDALQEEYTVLAATEERFRTLEELLRTMAPKKVRFESVQAEQQQLAFRITQHDSLLLRLGREIDTMQAAAQRATALEGDATRFQELRDKLEQLGTLEKKFLTLREARSATLERFRGLEQQIRLIGEDVQTLRERSTNLAALEDRVRDYDHLVREQEILTQAQVHAARQKVLRKEAEQADATGEQCRAAIHILDAELAKEDEVQEAIQSEQEKKEVAAREQAAHRSRMESLASDLTRIDERLREVLGAGRDGSCPTCHQNLGDHFDSLVQEIESERSRCRAAHDACRDRLEAAAGTYTAADRALVEAVLRRDALQKIREDRQSHLSRLTAGEELADKARRGWEEEARLLRNLGLETFDLARLQEVTVQREVLEQVKGQVQRLAGEVSRLPLVEEQHHVLVRAAEDCIHEEQILLEQMRVLAFSPKEKEEREKEMRCLMPLWQEYLRLGEKAAMIGEKKEQIGEIVRERDADIRKRDEREHALRILGFDPDQHASLLREMEEKQTTHIRYIEVRTRLEEVPALTKQRDGKKNAMERLRSETDALTRRIQELAFDPETIPRLEQITEACLNRLHGIEREMDTVQLAARHSQEEIARLEREISRAVTFRAELGAQKQEKEVLELTREAMGAFVAYLLNVVKGQVQGEVGQILSEITDGRYDTVIIDNEFNLLIHDLGEDYPAQRFSGGEQDDIAIALRIALSRYLAALHQVHDSTFLIFDEIFGSQDEARRGNLLQALRTQESHFPQILLISHIAEVQGEFSHTLSVEMRPDQTSVVQELSA
ncbi:MAG: SMC family ATPase [Methanomicrobiales archaeon]|nr:SMC family ATPase [Methanomicrobiales archaeon]